MKWDASFLNASIDTLGYIPADFRELLCWAKVVAEATFYARRLNIPWLKEGDE